MDLEAILLGFALLGGAVWIGSVLLGSRRRRPPGPPAAGGRAA